MNVIRSTRVWFNPKKQANEYVQRLVVDSKGTVDLAASYCSRHRRELNAVSSLTQDLVEEMTRLLINGYSVNVPGLGVIEPCVKSKQRPYAESAKCCKADITGLELKLKRSRHFAIQMKCALESIVVR